MPTARVPIPDSEYTVSRNAIMSVVQELKNYTNMGKDVSIIFPNESDAVPTPGSTIDDKDRRVPYLTKKILHVEVEQDTDPESMLNVHINSTNNSPIVLDKEIGLTITPIYFRHNVTLTIHFRSDSRSEVANWRNGIKTRLADGAQFGLLHRLQFNFHIPDAYYQLIRDIHKIKETNYPTGESFDNYFKRISTSRITPIHDPKGAFRALTVQETQTRVLGTYELTDMPDKPEKDDDNATWKATLVYKFHYMKPEYMYARYPISVYNELIPEKYLSHQNLEDNYRKHLVTSHRHLLDYRSFELQEQIPRTDEAIGFVRYPYYDDKNLGESFLGYMNVASFLVGVGEDKHTLINLDELGDYIFNPDILDWIKEEEWKYIGKPHKSVLAVFLKKGDEIVSYADLQFDNELNIRSTKDLDIRDEHRIVIAVAWDWQGLDREAISRAQRWPDAFKWIIGAINKALLGVTYVYNYGVNEGDPFKRKYEPHDFDIAIAILLGRETKLDSYPTGKILSIADKRLIETLKLKSRQMKTVFASAIIVQRHNRM